MLNKKILFDKKIEVRDSMEQLRNENEEQKEAILPNVMEKMKKIQI